MYTCEHRASNLVQDATFKNSEIHVTVNVRVKSYMSTTTVF